jgi:hypothetical protein
MCGLPGCVLQRQLADAHARLLRLRHGVRLWRRYVVGRHHKSVQAELAAGHYDRVLLSGGLTAFKQRVRHGADKRKLVFAAAIHRRSWLIWRAFKAWRCALFAKSSLYGTLVAKPAAVPAELYQLY